MLSHSLLIMSNTVKACIIAWLLCLPKLDLASLLSQALVSSNHIVTKTLTLHLLQHNSNCDKYSNSTLLNYSTTQIIHNSTLLGTPGDGSYMQSSATRSEKNTSEELSWSRWPFLVHGFPLRKWHEYNILQKVPKSFFRFNNFFIHSVTSLWLRFQECTNHLY